jgi:hypothetical protein
MGVLEARGFRYDIENGALHVSIVDLGPEWPRSTMFPRDDISLYHPPWWAPFS